MSVSINGCKERDKYILSYCKLNNIPLQVSMGGGYSPILRDIIEAHANTFRLADFLGHNAISLNAILANRINDLYSQNPAR